MTTKKNVFKCINGQNFFNRNNEKTLSGIMCAAKCSKQVECLFFTMDPVSCIHMSSLSIVQDPSPKYASSYSVSMKHIGSSQLAMEETDAVQQVWSYKNEVFVLWFRPVSANKFCFPALSLNLSKRNLWKSVISLLILVQTLKKRSISKKSGILKRGKVITLLKETLH